METPSKKVNLKSINARKIGIEKIDDFAEAYVFELELDSTPDLVWQEIFRNEHKTSQYLLRRQIQIVGKKLRVVTVPDEMESKIDWVKSLVEATNRRIESHNKEVEKKRKVDEQKKTKERETMDKMRKSLNK